MKILIAGEAVARHSVWEGKERTSWTQPAYFDTGAMFPIQVMIRLPKPEMAFEPGIEYELLPSAFKTDERDNMVVKFAPEHIGSRLASKPAQKAAS